MARAWALFCIQHNFPAVPFAAIGRRCFQAALAAAWAEGRRVAALVKHGTAALEAMLRTFDVPVRVGVASRWIDARQAAEWDRQRREVELALALAPSY